MNGSDVTVLQSGSFVRQDHLSRCDPHQETYTKAVNHASLAEVHLAQL